MHVLLLGDSTIDNDVWVREGKSVGTLLRERLGSDVKITNYAADGYTSADVLEGRVPSISYAARKKKGDPFPVKNREVFQPFEHAAKLKGVTHVVLSVGGNDVREVLQNMSQLPQRIGAFRKNYPKIVKRCLEITPKVCLMLQYRPSLAQEREGYGVYSAMSSIPGPGTGVDKINRLMETIYQPVFELARKHSLALIDLPRSFDINDSSLYCCQIEPSEKGGKLVCELIAHALTEHDNKKACFYVKRPKASSIETEACEEKTPWSINGKK